MKGKSLTDINDLPYGNCTFVLATYPRRKLIHDFEKPPVPEVFYMPLWTKCELDIIASCFPTVKKWENRFNVLGGIPEYVFDVTNRKPFEMIQELCYQYDFKNCIPLVNLNTTIPVDLTLLVHVTSSPPFTEASITFASRGALAIMAKVKGCLVKQKNEKMGRAKLQFF